MIKKSNLEWELFSVFADKFNVLWEYIFLVTEDYPEDSYFICDYRYARDLMFVLYTVI